MGFDFGNTKVPFQIEAVTGMGPTEILDSMFRSLSGSFTHFSIKHDSTTPAIGIALFCAGGMDAFHTLAAGRLIEATADNTTLIPFTWAICRLFNALILVTGVSLLNGKGEEGNRRGGCTVTYF
tara:strand:- start:1003 stop:1374 length:372 start_codon:yes stop_codon:yes gene_type:complete